jgi:putative transposase
MIEPEHPRLSVARQCELVSISRSGFYYQPAGETTLNLALMRLIDAQFLETPWSGSRQMARHLRREGYVVGRKRVRRLMAKMGLAPIYQRPRTTIPHLEHRIHPYLLRDLVITRPNQVWCADITYIPMRRGFLYLIAVMDWSSRKVLSWRVSNTMDVEFCIEALEDEMQRFGCPEIFNTDSKNDGVGSFAAILSYQATNCPRISGTARCPSRSDPNTDRPGFVSFPGSVGRLSHRAVRFCLTGACDPRRA